MRPRQVRRVSPTLSASRDVLFVIVKFHLVALLLSCLAVAPQIQAQDTTPAAATLIAATGAYELRLVTGGVLAAVPAGQQLYPDDQALTYEDGRMSLLLRDETLIKLSRNSSFTLKAVDDTAGWTEGAATGSANSGSQYEINSGKLWFLNKNRDNNIQISTPTVTAAIRGTEVVIEVLADGTSLVSVVEGQVQASNALGTVTVSAGQQAVAAPGAAPFVQALVDPDDAVQWTIAIPDLFAAANFPLRSNDQDFLAAEMSRLATLQGATPATLVELAAVQRDAGSPGAAIATLTAVPESDEQALVRGWSLLDSSDYQAALDTFLSIGNQTLSSQLGLVIGNIHLQNLAQARTLLDTMLPPDGTMTADRNVHLADAWLSLLEGDVSSARGTLQRMTSAFPDFANSWGLLAVSDVLLLDNAAALTAAETAVTLAPNDPNVWVLLSYVHQAMMDIGQAEAAIRRGLEHGPDHVTSLYNLAKLRFSSDYTEEAAAVAEKALVVAPDSEALLTLLGYIQLAEGASDQAAEYFNRARAVNPLAAEAWLGMALVNTRRGDVNAALLEISTAVLASPRNSLFRSYWAKILYQFERYQQALDVLDIAKHLDDQDPTPYLYGALIMRDLNRPLDALQSLNKAIELNDNRGVYRSRFLLDKDLAVKNVDLSLLYQSLNLGAWSQYKASISTKLDYMNASAHLFLGGSYGSEPGRSWSRNTENLLARLLMPANQNTFNNFNNYTVMFEQPDLAGTAEVAAGSFDALDRSAVLFGSDPGRNLAFQVAYKSSGNDGWRGSNEVSSTNPVFYGKWDATSKQQLMLVAAKSKIAQADDLSRPYEFDNPVQPDDDFSSEVSRLELGYHHAVNPDVHFLTHYSKLQVDSMLQDHTCMTTACDDADYIDQVVLFGLQQPYDLAQAQLFTRFANHQVISGASYFDGTDALAFSAFLDMSRAPAAIPLAAENFTLARKSKTIYVHDIWQPAASWVFDAAVYRDDYITNDLGANLQYADAHTSLRLGAMWLLNPEYTVRLASVESVTPFASDRLEPSDVAGIPVYRNGLPGSLVDESHASLSRDFGKGFWQLGVFNLDRILEPGNTLRSKAENSEEVMGIDWQLNYMFNMPGVADMPGAGFTIAARFQYQDIESGFDTELNRRDWNIGVDLTWVNQSGLGMTLAQTHRNIDFATSARSDERLWLTDFLLTYQLGVRKGRVVLAANNLFDNKMNWVVDDFIFEGRTPRRELRLSVEVNF